MSRPQVDEVRKQHAESACSDTRIGADGKERRLPKAKVKAAPEEEPEPPCVRNSDEVLAEQKAERERRVDSRPSARRPPVGPFRQCQSRFEKDQR